MRVFRESWSDLVQTGEVVKLSPITELLNPNPLERYEDGGIPGRGESAVEEVGP